MVNVDFSDGQAILTDTLPLSATYGSPTVGNVVDVTNSGNLNCSIASNTLACRASGGNVGILNVLGGFDVTIVVTPTITDTLQNPRSGGVCQVDPDGIITEDSESNNSCSDTVGSSGGVYLPVILKNS